MSFPSFFAQLLNGLAGASALFLVAAGLTLIFGVTRIVNFAHGSLYMLGAFIAYSLVAALPSGPFGFWGGVLLAALAVALIGAAIEVLLLKRIYAAPELLQLLFHLFDKEINFLGRVAQLIDRRVKVGLDEVRESPEDGHAT